MNSNLDVVIIGAGTAGLAALREVRKRTERFVLINDGPYGTTCARVGCMPSKALIEAANAFHRRESFAAFGIEGANALRVELAAVLRRVRSLRDDFVASTLRAIADLGERNVAGRARLTGPDRVEVNGRMLQARRIIIATGSRPVVPKPWQAFGDRILTTDSLFEQPTLPGRIGVVGLGPVGVELAQALARLGIDVHGFDTSCRVSGLTDEAVNEVLSKRLGREFAIHCGAPAELTDHDDGVEIRSGDARVVVDCVIAALGRRPNIDGLGLEALGVELDERGMPPVDLATMRIAETSVFIAGDVDGHGPLLHEATDDGHIAGLNAVAEEQHRFRRRVPMGIVFCDPEVAMVGKRSAELPDDAITAQVSFDRQGRARTAERNYGLLRIYADRKDGRLLGAEMCVPAAEHFAHLLALAIEHGLSVHDMLRMPFYHPVLEEGFRSALRGLARQLPQVSVSDLAGCEALGCEALE